MDNDCQENTFRTNKPKKSSGAKIRNKGIWITIVDIIILLVIFGVMRAHLSSIPVEKVCIGEACYSLKMNRVKSERLYQLDAKTTKENLPDTATVTIFLSDHGDNRVNQKEVLLTNGTGTWVWNLRNDAGLVVGEGNIKATARFDFGRRIQVPLTFKVWRKDVEVQREK